MSTSRTLRQPWKELREQIKAADKAAKLAYDGEDSIGARPFCVASSEGNPYPASPSMRINGGWDRPLIDAHKVRTRAGKTG